MISIVYEDDFLIIEYKKVEYIFNFKLMTQNFINTQDKIEIIDKLSEQRKKGLYNLKNDLYKYYMKFILYNDLIFEKYQVITYKRKAIMYYNWLNCTYSERILITKKHNDKYWRDLKSRKKISLKKAIYISELLNRHINDIFFKEV